MSTVYRSSDTSAPVLNGTVGSLVALLDACLVNGYGSKTALGFTKSFSATNKASYRQPTAGANGFYLDVDDSIGNYARLRGYETMSAVATGAGPFPTDTQISGGLYLAKTDQAAGNSTARPWVLVGNAKFFALFVNVDASAASGNGNLAIFGDYTNYKSGDAYSTILIAGTGSSSTGTPAAQVVATVGTALSGHYSPRSYTQVGSSIPMGKHINYAESAGASYVGGAGSALPRPITGSYVVGPIILDEPAATDSRGELPGLWAPLHARPLTHGDTLAGTGTYAGKTFEAFNVYSNGQLWLETSNTW